MLTVRRCAVLVPLFLACVWAVAVGASAQTADPSKYKVTTRVAKLQVDVAGYVETRLLKDTTSDCFPGERWIQTNRFEFETGGYVNQTITNISGRGFPTTTTSTFSRAAGRTLVEGDISDYKATNYCSGEQQKLDGAPTCTKHAGKLAVALTPGGLPDPDEELAPLNGRPLLLSLKRAGGGKDAVRCIGPGAGQVTGKDTGAAIATTSIVPGISAILPANLDAVKVFAIRRGQRVRRTIVIDGPCRSVKVTVLVPPGRSPDPGALNADGDCRLVGKVVLTLRARPAARRKG